MKFISVLIILIFNSTLWSLINSVKNNKNQNELNIVEQPSKDLSKVLNDGAESSTNPLNQKYKEILKFKPKITKNDKTENNYNEKRLHRKEYLKNYYQKNREARQEYKRIYYRNNQEKMRGSSRKYYHNNKEKKLESMRKYRLRKKNDIQQNDCLKLIKIQSHNNEGTSSDNQQYNNYGAGLVYASNETL
ncbi:unnamed protein product [Meloidogyne enterolobii]|uniref:Uncharacterized protein n=1 Tax=Meloidogyne enterolobii TaxID=390850 RepID=A0ACB0Y618_MELEN